MQHSTNDPLDLNKGQMHSGQYDGPPPPVGGTWDQLNEQEKAKEHLKQISKTERYENQGQ